MSLRTPGARTISGEWLLSRAIERWENEGGEIPSGPRAPKAIRGESRKSRVTPHTVDRT